MEVTPELVQDGFQGERGVCTLHFLRIFQVYYFPFKEALTYSFHESAVEWGQSSLFTYLINPGGGGGGGGHKMDNHSLMQSDVELTKNS